MRHYGHFVDLNQDNLRDSMHLYEGREYIIPPVPADTVPIAETVAKKATEIKSVSNILNDDIFGKDYASTEIKSNKLQGAIYYLISGHGGPDPGAIEKYEGKIIAEDEYAYDIHFPWGKDLHHHQGSQ